MDWKDQLEPDTQKKSEVRKAKRNKISDLSKLSRKSKDPEISKRIEKLQDEEVKINKSLSMFIELLKNKDSNVREQAVEALGNIGGSQVVEPLFNMLGDDDEIVRESAATALKKFNDQRVMNALYDALEAQNKDIRLVAIEALGNISDLRALPYIRKALKDVTQEVRVKAAKTLELIGKQANYYYQNMEKDIYLENLDLGERAIPQLIEALKDEDVRIRSYAVLALGHKRHEKAVKPLIEVLKDEQHLRVKKEIVIALGKIGGTNAIDPLLKVLEEVLEDDHVSIRHEAAKALEKIEFKKTIALKKIEFKKTIESQLLGLGGENWKAKFEVIYLIIKRESLRGIVGIVPVRKIKEIAKENNIEEDFVEKVIEQLRSNGEIYSPRKGYVKFA